MTERLEWQSIETAPKDGTSIDIWVRNFVVGEGGKVTASDVGRYPNVRWGITQEVYARSNGEFEHKYGEFDEWIYYDSPHWLSVSTGGYRATHWKPKPEPPK